MKRSFSRKWSPNGAQTVVPFCDQIGVTNPTKIWSSFRMGKTSMKQQKRVPKWGPRRRLNFLRRPFRLESCSKSKVDVFAPERSRGRFRIQKTTPKWKPESTKKHLNSQTESRPEFRFQKCYFPLKSSRPGLKIHFRRNLARWWCRGYRMSQNCDFAVLNLTWILQKK